MGITVTGLTVKCLGQLRLSSPHFRSRPRFDTEERDSESRSLESVSWKVNDGDLSVQRDVNPNGEFRISPFTLPTSLLEQRLVRERVCIHQRLHPLTGQRTDTFHPGETTSAQKPAAAFLSNRIRDGEAASFWTSSC